MRALYEEYRGRPDAALMVAARIAQRRGLEQEPGPVERVDFSVPDFIAVCNVNERARRLGAGPKWRVADDPLSKEFRRILLGEDVEGSWV